ncbi:MAG: ABC transporter ATP-binding protein [Rhodobacteraceae bacterium]|nr:ABC transporter ATP-binding protein [Paracoccaceae bacterium]
MLLEINDLIKSYPLPGGAAQPVLQGVSLTLEAGHSLALTGESGSGKSTLLHLVAALDGFDDGEITLSETPLSGLDDAGRAAIRRDVVALVFQQFNLVPSLTVAQNVALQARMAGRHDPARDGMLMARLGLEGCEARYPEQLSGGQQQRVAIARALSVAPQLLLADEPTGNLDEENAATVLDLMLELVSESGTALFLVTHSDKVAARLDRRIHLRAGRIG